MLEFFWKNLVSFIAKMPLSTNLFRLGSSIQKLAVSSGAAPMGLLTIKIKIQQKIEIYAQKIFLKCEIKNVKKKFYDNFFSIFFVSLQTF